MNQAQAPFGTPPSPSPSPSPDPARSDLYAALRVAAEAMLDQAEAAGHTLRIVIDVDPPAGAHMVLHPRAPET